MIIFDRQRVCSIAGVIAWSFLASVRCATAADSAVRFCVVPVKDGVATAADVDQAWRITNIRFQIPGLPSLVFTPGNRRGQWTIDANRRLVPYAGSFPHSYIDRGHWVREPWSSRIVAFTYGAPPTGGGVSVMAPGSGFEKIADGAFHDIAILPRRKVTVATTNTGSSMIVGDHGLTPWLSGEQMEAHDIHGIYSLHDAPFLNATVVIDLDRRVYVLTDNDEWYRVGALDKKDYGRLLDAPGSQGELLAANYGVLFIRKDLGRRPFGASVLDGGKAFGASLPFKVSSLFGQVLTYSNGLLGYGRGWRRLTSSGFETIPGGDVGVPRSDASAAQIHDLPTIGRTLIEGFDGLFLYDGKTFSPVSGAERKVIGNYPVAYDLPSIHRIVVISETGIFELTKEGNLAAVNTPFPAERPFMQTISDWPEAGVGLISTRSGLFILDADLVAKPIQGGDAVEELPGYSPFTGVNLSTGEMVLTGRRALFLAVDTDLSHDDACRKP